MNPVIYIMPFTLIIPFNFSKVTLAEGKPAETVRLA